MLGVLVALQLLTAPVVDPFAFFSPTVVIAPGDRQRLDGGQPIARVIPGTGLEVAIFAAVPVNIDGDRLVAWMRRIEELKRSTYVLAIRRFSNPPRLDDLTDLTLDDRELSAIQACRPAHCGLKLSAAEMAALQRVASPTRADWKAATEQRFREIVLARVNAYLADGRIGAYDDRAPAIRPAEEFARLVDHSPFLTTHLPDFAASLRRASAQRPPGVEVFLYWSKEHLANRPIVSVTEVNIIRSKTPGVPEALVAGKEIFSTHYVNASLSLTALLPGAAGGPNYLAYVNRSSVDMLSGPFAGLIRWVLQRRLRAEAANVLLGLQKRLERGDPPPQPAVVRFQSNLR